MNPNDWNDERAWEDPNSRYARERYDEDRFRRRGSWGAQPGYPERQPSSERSSQGRRDLEDGPGREPFSERGFERGSYAARYGFRGNPNVRAPEVPRQGGGEWDGPSSQGRGDYGSPYRRERDWRNESADRSSESYQQSPYFEGEGRERGYRGSSAGRNSGWSQAGSESDSQYGRGTSSDPRYYGGSSGSNSWLGYGSHTGASSAGPGFSGQHSGYSSTAFGGRSERSMSPRGAFAGRGPKGYRRNEERLREDISECLKRNPDVDASDIEVEVQGGSVVLKGRVSDRYQKRSAEDCIEGISGVDDISNQVQVRSSADASERGEEELTVPYNRNRQQQDSKSRTSVQDKSGLDHKAGSISNT